MPNTLTMPGSRTDAQLTYKTPKGLDVSFASASRIDFWKEVEPKTIVEHLHLNYDDLLTTLAGGLLILGAEQVTYNRPHPTALLEEVDREEKWFRSHYAQLLSDFGARYVAVHGSRVVDDDAHLGVLVDRFFKQRGDVAAYFGFVGDRPPSGLAADAG